MTEDVAPARAGPRPIVRAVIGVVVGAWLCWQIAAAGVAALAVRSGDRGLLAATATATHPEAGSILAEATLGGGDAAGAARIARTVVLADPTNDRALRVLGLATEQLGDRAAGARLMRQAGGLGWRDTLTQVWVLRDAATRNDTTAVMERTDALARRNRLPDLTRAIFFAALADPQMRAALADRLAKRPTWRIGFFADVRQRLPASLAAGMEALFDDLHAAHRDVTPGEQLDYIDRLVDLAEFRRARTRWAIAFGIRPAALTATPYDGDFVRVASRPADRPASQFEWSLNPDTGGAVTFGGSRGSALAIPAGLADGTMLAAQLMILAPGTHALTARIDGDPAAAAAAWRITCLPSGQDVARRLPHGVDDELSAVTFDVPDGAGCGAQRLTLAARDRPAGPAASVVAVAID